MHHPLYVKAAPYFWLAGWLSTVHLCFISPLLLPALVSCPSSLSFFLFVLLFYIARRCSCHCTFCPNYLFELFNPTSRLPTHIHLLQIHLSEYSPFITICNLLICFMQLDPLVHLHHLMANRPTCSLLILNLWQPPLFRPSTQLNLEVVSAEQGIACSAYSVRAQWLSKYLVTTTTRGKSFVHEPMQAMGRLYTLCPTLAR